MLKEKDQAPCKSEDRDLDRIADLRSRHDLLCQVLDFLQEAVILTDSRRRIVFANHFFLKLAEVEDEKQVFGLRPGEALDCIHAQKGGPGCGRSAACEKCGSLFAILSSQEGNPTIQDFSLTKKRGNYLDSLDFKAFARQVTLESQSFTFFSLIDVSDEKRRHALERTFFHDILNTAGALHGLVGLAREAPAQEQTELLDTIFLHMDFLVQDIEAHKILNSAERRSLEVRPTPLDGLRLLQNQIRLYSSRNESRTIELTAAPGSESAVLVSDEKLLSRIIGNMIKNALEASRPGDQVTAGCRRRGGEIEFFVHNPAVIPPDIQPQIFHRSFSTKGANRGLGTYGMRLIAESFLGGRVGFTSTEEAGTTFTVSLPLEIEKGD